MSPLIFFHVYLHFHFFEICVCLIFIVQTYCSQFSLRNLRQISGLRLITTLTNNFSQTITYPHFLIIFQSFFQFVFFFLCRSHICNLTLFPRIFDYQFGFRSVYSLIFLIFSDHLLFFIIKRDNW